MSHDDDWAWTEEMLGSPAHPRARELFDAVVGGAGEGAPAELLSPDLGALEHDVGHGAAREFPEWRAEHPDTTVGEYLREVAATWNPPTVYGEELLEEEKIRALVEADPHFGADFHDGLWVLDVTVIATAFSQLVLEGRIDADAKPIVRVAIARQRHPLVLRESYPEDVIAEREEILANLAKVLERT